MSDFDIKNIMRTQLEVADEHLFNSRLFDAEEIYEQFEAISNDAKQGLATILFLAERDDEALAMLDGIESAEACASRIAIYSRAQDEKLTFSEIEKMYTTYDGINWQQYGNALQTKKEYSAAIDVFSREDSLVAALGCVECYIASSELEKARDVLVSIVRQDKNNAGALLELVSLSTNESELRLNAIDIAARLKRFHESRATHTKTKSAIANGLGKVFEHLKDYDKSFYWYKKGCDIENALITDEDFENKTSPTKVATVYTKEFIEQSRNKIDAPECPLVFVFGMPRSGTTLVEQTLVAHPNIATVGESVGISEMIHRIQRDEVRLESPDEALVYYMENWIEERRMLDGELVVDKMPGNFHYVGMIYQLFPNAKFIYVKRNALDNAFGCYTTMFSQGHKYSYDFKRLADEYKEHEEYMKLWNEVLPSGTILTVNYEDVVANHDKETRRILDHVGLEYDDACEKFYEVKRDVKTASLAQVVKPIYTSSTRRADKYKEHLIELQELLETS